MTTSWINFSMSLNCAIKCVVFVRKYPETTNYTLNESLELIHHLSRTLARNRRNSNVKCTSITVCFCHYFYYRLNYQKAEKQSEKQHVSRTSRELFLLSSQNKKRFYDLVIKIFHIIVYALSVGNFVGGRELHLTRGGQLVIEMSFFRIYHMTNVYC